MSKYNQLWNYISKNGAQTLTLSFEEIADIAGIAIDHSFLNYKKVLNVYGYKVKKISLKEKTVIFEKSNEYLDKIELPGI